MVYRITFDGVYEGEKMIYRVDVLSQPWEETKLKVIDYGVEPATD